MPHKSAPFEAQHKRTDFFTLRDLALDNPGVLNHLADCYKYWIALTDCDGFRIDTLKHVSFEEGRNFCGAIKEFAANLGKASFLLIGEVAGGDFAQDRYLDVLGGNLDAVLDLGDMRPTLQNVAKGLTHPRAYFDGFDAGSAEMGSHRISASGTSRSSTITTRSSESRFDSRVKRQRSSRSWPCSCSRLAFHSVHLLRDGTIVCWTRGVRMQVPAELEKRGSRRSLPARGDVWSLSSPAHAEQRTRSNFAELRTVRHGGRSLLRSGLRVRRTAALGSVRKKFPVLRQGRQYLRPSSVFGGPFTLRGPGELITWSRILSDEEALCVVNAHGTQLRGSDVLVDAGLNPPGSELTVIANTAETASGSAGGVARPIGSRVPVKLGDGTAFVEIRNLPPSEVLVLVNHASEANS